MSRPYDLRVDPKLNRKLLKILKRNPVQYDIILKKADEILENPYHYKPLRAPLQHFRRVHIDSHFALLFSVDEQAKRVTLGLRPPR